MTPIIDDAILGSRIDCQNFDLLNVGRFTPIPDGLVSKGDPAIRDPRVPPILSVTDASVNADAAITQDKLSLDGVIPVEWLGTASDQAAQGDLVERVENKGMAGGYAEVDSGNRILDTNVTTGIGLGTVSQVDISFPSPLSVTSTPVNDGAGTLTSTWEDAPDGSYLGVNGPDGFTSNFVPSFIAGEIPIELVPVLDAAKFTTGTFTVEQLPVAIGVGVDAAAGVVPDPGEDGDPDSYLGRDMEWHTYNADISYQPTCPMPTVTLDSWTDTDVVVTVRSPLKGSSLLIRINAGNWALSEKTHSDKTSLDDVHDTITVHEGDRIWAYVAKAGYNNSDNSLPIWTVTTPLTEVF